MIESSCINLIGNTCASDQKHCWTLPVNMMGGHQGFTTGNRAAMSAIHLHTKLWRGDGLTVITPLHLHLQCFTSGGSGLIFSGELFVLGMPAGISICKSEVVFDASDGVISSPKKALAYDIDAPDAHNYLAVVKYVEDIYRLYKITEGTCRPFSSYMSCQAGINERMRAFESTNSNAHEEGVDTGEALSTRSKASYMHKPKLLSQLSALLSDIGLNIREAYVFSTTDGYSFDVFVVDGWPIEDTDALHKVLEASILTHEGSWSGSDFSTSGKSLPFLGQDCESDIDTRLLKIVKKVASGACGVMFLGTYGGEEVAVKVLNPDNFNQNAWSEFKQEICLLREVDRPNTVLECCYCTFGAHDIQDSIYYHEPLQAAIDVRQGLMVVLIRELLRVLFCSVHGIATSVTRTVLPDRVKKFSEMPEFSSLKASCILGRREC